MNKNIKRLVESLFDGDYDDIMDDDTISLNSKMIGDKLLSTDIFILLFDKIVTDAENKSLKDYLLLKDNLMELSDLSHELNGFNILFLRISLFRDNVESFNRLFDILKEYDIQLNIGVLEFSLENESDNVYSIKDLCDLSDYDDILTIKEFIVDYGRLKDCKGFPSNVSNLIKFMWIKYLGSMEGFPITEYYITLLFDCSKMPEDWNGCPTILQSLEFEHDIPIVNRSEFVKNNIGTLYNIPYNLTFELNNPKAKYKRVGSFIISKYWDLNLKKEIKQYITGRLKSQYKNITLLKNKLCKQN